MDVKSNFMLSIAQYFLFKENYVTIVIILDYILKLFEFDTLYIWSIEFVVLNVYSELFQS